jgi:hypothetical protein
MLVKAFRLFVSSTFADFSAERDVLQRHVFPALDHYCAAKGYQFDALDLRWGVNEEAQLDQRTEEICLAEIRAAKQGYPPPNFLILLGDRYGFVPLPYAIAQDEFDAILAWLEGAGRQNAVAELCGVYRRDDNYLLPRGLSGSATDGGPLVGSYTLRSRIDELLDLRAAGPWAEHEAKLRAILQQTSDGLLAAGRIDAATHEKYFLSLTDREIIAGLPEYRKLPNGGTLSPSLAPDGAPAIAFIRDIANESRAPVEVARLFFENEPRLETLKERLKGALTSDQVITLRTNIDDRGELPPVYLAEFAVQIEGKLRSAIDRYIARVEAVELSPDYALTSEQDVHRTFAQTKLEVFVGRENALATIARYLAGAGDQPLVLHGRSGIGKSALMARAFLDALAMGSAPVVVRFVGASAASSNLQALLGSIVDDLAAHGIVEKPAELEQNANKFRDQVRELLSCVSGPAIIYLDGLDQLQKPLDLGWLPSKLPEGFKAVLSALDDPAYPADSLAYQELRKRFAPDSFLEIKPLGRAQGREILTRFERQAGCRLQDGQRGYVIHKFAQAGASPLYLRTAFAIARNWKSFHQAGAGRYVLADDTQGLVAQFIAELSSVQHHESELVTHTLGYLAAAKNGLSQKELTEILSRDAGVMSVVSSRPHGAVTEKLPPSVWVRLNRDLSPFLIQKQIDEQPLLQFFHREVLRVARKRHYEACKTELHSALAAYFESQATDGDDGVVYGKRSLSELPYQFQNAGNISRLDEILVSPDWMQQKLNAFGPQILVADYDRYATRDMQRLIGRTLRLTASICSRDPCQLLPQLLGRLIARADPAVASFLDDARRHLRLPALVTQRPSLRPPGAEIARLEGHTHVVTTLAVLPVAGWRQLPGTAPSVFGIWRPVPRWPGSKVVRAMCIPWRRYRTAGWRQDLGTAQSGYGTSGPAPRRPDSKATLYGSPRLRRYRTAGWHRVPKTRRSACGTQIPTPKRSESKAAGSAHLQRYRMVGWHRPGVHVMTRTPTTKPSGCGTAQRVPKPPGSRGTPRGSMRWRYCPTAGWRQDLGTAQSGYGTSGPAPRRRGSRFTASRKTRGSSDWRPCRTVGWRYDVSRQRSAFGIRTSASKPLG